MARSVEDPGADIVPEGADDADPGLVYRPLQALYQAPVRAEGAPVAELGTFSTSRESTVSSSSHRMICQAEARFWSLSGLPPAALEWRVHSGPAARMSTLPPRDRLARVNGLDVGADVPRPWVVPLMSLDRLLRVVDRDEVQLPGELRPRSS